MTTRELLKNLLPERTAFNDDRKFIALYPDNIRKISQRHWTPVAVIRQAARFLSQEKNKRILDIGSGIGKFCLVGAHDNRENLFFGIEQREPLVQIAENTKYVLAIKNAFFIHENIVDTDLSHYDHFYFFNSFFEQIESNDRIDNGIAYSKEDYDNYTRILYQKLSDLPAGTKLVTYHGTHQQVPTSFVLHKRAFDNLLDFWIKK